MTPSPPTSILIPFFLVPVSLWLARETKSSPHSLCPWCFVFNWVIDGIVKVIMVCALRTKLCYPRRSDSFFWGFPSIPTHLAIHYTSTSHVARSRCARGLNSWHYGQANPGNLLGTIRGQDGQSATNLNCTKALTHRHLVNSKTPKDSHGPGSAPPFRQHFFGDRLACARPRLC